MSGSARVNRGSISFPSGSREASLDPPAGRTLIVTGIARSGTSMVAATLREAGIYFGKVIYDVVHEDAQILQQLISGKRENMLDLIRERNAQHEVWGFKIPNLHHMLPCADLGIFRAPHLISIYRDPVAIAVRERLSEHIDEAKALVRASNAQVSMIEYCARSKCPTLLLSYEKALLAPEEFVDGLLAFCGIKCTPEQRLAMLQQVQPNNPSYLQQANTTYEGQIDGIMNGRLHGWCRKAGWLQPVDLEVFRNDVLVGTILADRFREDLADAGIGNGNHGFVYDLGHLPKDPGCRIRISVKDTVFDLKNSNMEIGALVTLT
jgi:hypothetical protein